MEIGGARRVSLDERQDLRSNTVLGEKDGLSAGMVLEVGTPARRCNGRQGPTILIRNHGWHGRGSVARSG
jgi:hypothetical protein